MILTIRELKGSHQDQGSGKKQPNILHMLKMLHRYTHRKRSAQGFTLTMGIYVRPRKMSDTLMR